MLKKSLRVALDVVFAGDMAGSADSCLRIAGEAATAREAGYQVGLLHTPTSPEEIVPISPEIRACVRQTGIMIVDPDRHTAARLLVIHPPCDKLAIRLSMTRVEAQRVVVVPEELVDVAGPENSDDLLLMPELSIAPTTVMMREGLIKNPKLRLEPRNWLPLVRKTTKPSRFKAGSPLRVGVIIPSDWPKAVEAIKDVVANDPPVEVYAWRDRGPNRQKTETPGNWKVLDGVEISIAWFLRRIDVLVLVQRPGRTDVPEVIIAAAQSAGKLVVASLSTIDHVPPAVVTAHPRDMIVTARQVLDNPQERARLVDDIDIEFSADRFLKRLGILTGTARPGLRKKAGATRQKPRVLFLPKGGVGLGHVARLLAIARRAGDDFDPIFVSLSETPGLIEDLGFRAEYIPSAVYAGVRPEDWNPWFQYELEQLIDAYDASAVVFDGSDPPAVLSRAVASRSWCHGVWVRRGMWAPGYNPSLQRSGAYDLIIEPGELAADRDRGATADRRHEVLQVDPITLLDPRELISREAAAAAIGFDPKRPAMLIQLGSGENRNILKILDLVITECRQHPDLQVAIAEWANTTVQLKLWPGVKILKGAPLSLYYRAFDFSISAAGYNSFHEVIGCGLPTLFVPNRAPGMDDQAARSSFAQDAGAAIELKEHEFRDLPDIFELLMTPKFRSVMQDNCRELSRKNGARAASRAIAGMVN